MKKSVLVIFGGKSVEHDISIITALQVLKNIDKSIYSPIPIYIERSGAFVTANNMEDVSIYKNFDKLAKKKRYLTFVSGEKCVAFQKNGKYSKSLSVDFALLCTHGRFGEDGALQGLLEISQIPFSSSNVLSSAVTMDKVFTKEILKSHNLPSLPYFEIKKEGEKIKNLPLKFPIILKPANLGSSIGIKVCKNEKEFYENLDFCFKFDNKILAEKYLENFEEYNCACVHINDEIKTSNVIKVEKKEGVYTFEDKYILENNKKVSKIDKGLNLKIKSLTEKIYKIFDSFGVIRVDYIFDNEKKKLYVNEVNNIPGSLAFYLFKDLSFKELITCLVEEGCERKFKENYLSAYDSEALDVFEKIELDFKKK